jgi:hypothetical protein
VLALAIAYGHAYFTIRLNNVNPLGGYLFKMGLIAHQPYNKAKAHNYSYRK